jgi:L-amino acid N-acyltransferase YncA
MGVVIPKAMDAIIKSIPKRYNTAYSNTPAIRNKPPISSTHEVNQAPQTVKNLGIPLLTNEFS